jgi:tetratricopeptide (TPR) repeat protein
MDKRSGSMIELFRDGNYAAVAMHGSPDEWETYAAMGLVGKCQEAIEGLNRFDHSEARFYLAVAHWINGDEGKAIPLLEGVSLPHAQNLLALIRKPQIHVLGQLPWNRRPPNDLLTAASEDSKFIVQNISFHPDDLPNEPYADIHSFYDPAHPPDFYVCAMVEWHVIPPNLQEIPCPTFGETSDYDVHIQAIYPWLQVFDEVFVTSQTEWEDVRRLVSVPVSTFPKSFGVSDDLPPLPSEPRNIDIFLSGTLTHPYNPDKARLLHQLLQHEDFEMRFINGFICSTAYNMLCGRSKVSLTYVRATGGMPTRGLEALSMGCAVVAQRGSVLSLYVGEEEGVVTYEFEKNDLASVIRLTLAQWPEFEQRARRGAEVIRQEFSLSKVASQYFRFLTFLAAKPRNPRQIRSTAGLDQKRLILSKGWLPSDKGVLQKMRQESLSRWEERLEKEETPRVLINMARELVLEYATSAPNDSKSQETNGLLDNALRLYRAGVPRFPRSLPLRFNFIRTALHFGSPAVIAPGLQLAEETLRQPEFTWAIDVLEDVFPWDFFSTYFNYRDYLDLVTKNLVQGVPVQEDLTRLILASLHYYIGRSLRDLAHLREAVILDPEFPFYKLFYAQELIKQKEAQKDEEASALLTCLMEESIAFKEAFELLEQLQAEKRIVHPRFSELSHKVGRALQQGSWKEEWQSEYFSPSPDLTGCDPKREVKEGSIPGRSPVPGSPDPQKRPPVINTMPRVSVLVFPRPIGRFLRGLLLDLQNQTIAEQLEIVIAGNLLTREERTVVDSFQRRYGNIVCLSSEEGESDYSFFNRAIKASSGQFLTLTCRGDRRRPDALESMAKALEKRSEFALVYPDVDIVDKEISQDHRQASSTAFYRWPEFNRTILFQKNYVGPQPVWRREIHDRHGLFDPEFRAAGDYELWLRIAPNEKFLHLSKNLGYHLIEKGSRLFHPSSPFHQEAGIARARHWPSSWGECPPSQDIFLIPGVLLIPSLDAETRSLSSWGIISSVEQGEIQGLMGLARDAVVREDWKVAEMALRTSIEQFPVFLGAQRSLAALLKMQGQSEEAAQLLQKATRVHPYALTIQNDLGVIHYERGDAAEAEKSFIQALRESPGDVNALISLAKLCYDQKRFHESVNYLRTAIGINPRDVDAWIGLALSALPLNDQGSWELAQKKILSLAPAHPLLPSLRRAFNRRKAVTSPKQASENPLRSQVTSLSQKGEGVPNKTPLISAVVTTYNSERFMRGLLEDLENQTMADQLEVVIVDSHSPQNERAIVEEFQKKYDNIVYVRTEERENSHKAFNRCIQLARGKYVTLACTDDRHRKDALERMVEALETHRDVALVYADVAITDRENETFEKARVRGHYRWPDFDPKLLFQIDYIGPQPVWRRQLHERYGHFDPEFWSAGDYEFWLRLACRETFLHIPEVLGLYYLSPNSNEHKNMSLSFQESEKARERYWPQEWGKRPTPFFNKNPFADSEGSADSGNGLKQQVLVLKQQGITFYNWGDRSGAENAFKQALAIDPRNTDVLVSMGKLCYESKRHPEALSYLQRAVQENPGDKDAHIGIALAAYEMNDLPTCQRAYEKARRLDPSHPVVQSLERLFASTKRAVFSRKEKAARGTSHDPKPFNDLGESLFNEGKVEEAKEQFQKSLNIDDRYVPSINNLGVVYFQQGRIGDAVQFFQRALEIRPGYAEAAENLQKCQEIKSNPSGEIQSV